MMKRDLAAGAAPAAGMVANSVFGLSLNEWYVVVGIIWFTVLIITKIPGLIGCAVCMRRRGPCDRHCKGD